MQCCAGGLAPMPELGTVPCDAADGIAGAAASGAVAVGSTRLRFAASPIRNPEDVNGLTTLLASGGSMVIGARGGGAGVIPTQLPPDLGHLPHLTFRQCLCPRCPGGRLRAALEGVADLVPQLLDVLIGLRAEHLRVPVALLKLLVGGVALPSPHRRLLGLLVDMLSQHVDPLLEDRLLVEEQLLPRLHSDLLAGRGDGLHAGGLSRAGVGAQLQHVIAPFEVDALVSQALLGQAHAALGVRLELAEPRGDLPLDPFLGQEELLLLYAEFT
eukprot:7708470-Pyramimonas_sp.AAC.2